MITKFKVFEEVRFQDVYVSKDNYINSFRREFNPNEEFVDNIRIKYKGETKTFTISYNHRQNHDLKKRIKERTTLKSMREFNYLLKKALIELFSKEYERNITSYSLYFVEYGFSIVLNIKYNDSQIRIGTLLLGLDVTVGKEVNIKSTL